MKKLLHVIATSAPFTPNISKISEKIGVSRPFLLKALRLLEEARLLFLISKNKKGMSYLSKPDKVFIRNTNLMMVLANKKYEKGSTRETIFVNQLSEKHQVALATKADFEIDDEFIFEIGVKNKNQSQIKDIKNSFLMKDNIEQGVKNIIPLWLFGFLY